MQQRHVPIALRKRVRQHALLLWQRQQGMDDEQILASLPQHLRVELSLALHQELLVKVPFFRDCGDPCFVRELIPHLQLEIFAAHECILSYGEVADAMYFVRRGTVQIVLPDGTLGELKQAGTFFGEIGVLLGIGRRTASVYASTTVDVLRLTKHAVDSVLLRYPDLADRLRQTGLERLRGGHTLMDSAPAALPRADSGLLLRGTPAPSTPEHRASLLRTASFAAGRGARASVDQVDGAARAALDAQTHPGAAMAAALEAFATGRTWAGLDARTWRRAMLALGALQAHLLEACPMS